MKRKGGSELCNIKAKVYQYWQMYVKYVKQHQPISLPRLSFLPKLSMSPYTYTEDELITR